MFFFLAPLGFAAAGYNAKTGWAALFFAVAGNSLISLSLVLSNSLPWGEITWEFFYFAVTASVFLWILSPFQGKGRFFRLPGIARFVAGSSVCALLVLGVLFHLLDNEAFYGYVKNQLEAIKSLYLSSGSDVVQKAMLESLTADFILETVKMTLTRGGALALCVFIFFANRHISLTLARVFRRRNRAGGMRSFHAPFFLIWVFSSSLLLILASRAAGLGGGEILGWNILTLCCMLYFAQGLGIIQYFLTGPSVPPLRRLLLSGLVIILLLSFGINAIFLGLIILLGIAENWAPFRRPKISGPPSTPGA
ncbi:MAG: YybS family protein [Treponema sp.]|jgi:hypothetical protein|nr:YybS family protein [Treponema sp.]